MAGVITPSSWAVEQFGAQAVEVVRCVAAGLTLGQRAARTVGEAGRGVGVVDNHPYGSAWVARHRLFAEQFAGLPGYEPFHPKGAPYTLAVVNGRVIIPFRFADSLQTPVTLARLDAKIPRQVSREQGVRPPVTLFDELDVDLASNLTVVYVAYAANADSDEVLGAWWGVASALDDDGRLLWAPERIDLGGTPIGSVVDAATFTQGAQPSLDLRPRGAATEHPAAEPEPDHSDAADGDE
ncbi:hypothetical protein [Actinokineospora inagensis]|uniref:hypothetical protein n=1 Tax=Actinokineospora inagensis TaxID=103730 RepID=UPI00040E4F47|nr:hypothetical protein [Actinokineospora inagensis]